MRLNNGEIKAKAAGARPTPEEAKAAEAQTEEVSLDQAAEKAWKTRQVSSFVKQSGQIAQGVRSVTGAAEAADRLASKPGALSKGYQTGVAGVGLVAGGLLAAQGVSEMVQGDTKQGVGDVVTGGLAGAAGVASLAKKTKLAGPLGVGATIAGGVSQIVNGDTAEEKTIGSVKTAGGALFAAGLAASGTIVGAPAGVVLNAAGATLVAGATVFENREGLKKLGARAAGVLRQAASAVAELSNDATDKVRELGNDTVDMVRELGNDTVDKVRELGQKRQ